MYAITFLSAAAICVAAGAEKPCAETAWSEIRKWYNPDRPLSETLAKLAKPSGLDPEDYRVLWVNAWNGRVRDEGRVHVLADDSETWDEARERLLRPGNTYAVAVQEGHSGSVPGKSWQQLVLLTIDGKILDRLSCEINSRYGFPRTEVPHTRFRPERDGATIVIRFDGSTNAFGGDHSWWHGSHHIVHAGKVWTYDTPQPPANEPDKPDIWNLKGLCRHQDRQREVRYRLARPEGESRFRQRFPIR